jgi:predicted nucleotidyltransferase
MRANRSGESALLLLDVIDVLTSAGVGYAVIGAMAASVYGAVRASMDADAVLSAGLRKGAELERTFREAGYGTKFTQGDFEDPVPGLLRLYDAHANRVDLLLGLRGMEAKAFSRVVRFPFQGMTLNFIGREDFVAMKAFAGGPTDLADAARVLAASRNSLDLDLLWRLARQFGPDAAKALERLLTQNAP